MSERKPIPFRDSLHSLLTDRLRTMILTQHLKPGDRINELALSASLGVSRTPMREALKVLASEKLVTLFPYRGAIVANLSPDLIGQLFEVEGVIESQAAALACDRATDAELDAFETDHHRMVALFEAGDHAGYFAVNQGLHEALVAMAHNSSLTEVHAGVMAQLERTRYAAPTFEHRWQRAVEQHDVILKMLKARDADSLPGMIRDHVLEIGRVVVTGLLAR